MEQLTQQQRTLADAALANKLNVIHHAYVDIAGDLIAGALMGQVLYWFGQGKDGRSRARIVKDGQLWIAKTRADWWEEIRISPKQYDRAAKILKERGFIEIKTFKFYGNPTTHIRIIPEAINAALDAWKVEQVKSILPEGEEPAAAGFNPLGNNRFTEGEERHSASVENNLTASVISLTETTTENEKEKTAEHTHTPAARPQETADAARHRLTVEEIAKGFEETWAEYPRKEGKTKARIAYEKAVRGMGSRKPDGLPYTAAEILAETILYRQHIERRMESGDLEQRYIPTGGSWFEREGWADDVPSISSTFADLYEGVDYNRNAADLRRLAASVGKAPEAERPSIWQRFRAIRAALPY